MLVRMLLGFIVEAKAIGIEVFEGLSIEVLMILRAFKLTGAVWGILKILRKGLEGRGTRLCNAGNDDCKGCL